jgi:hypothetical protein
VRRTGRRHSRRPDYLERDRFVSIRRIESGHHGKELAQQSPKPTGVARALVHTPELCL